MFTKFERVNFDEYRREVYIPDWVDKALNNYQILKEKLSYNLFE